MFPEQAAPDATADTGAAPGAATPVSASQLDVLNNS